MSATLSRFLRDCTERYDAAKGKVATLFEAGAMDAARFDGEENRYFHPAVCVPAKICDERSECARLSLLGKILCSARTNDFAQIKIRLTLLCGCAGKLRQFRTVYSRLLFVRYCRLS